MWIDRGRVPVSTNRDEKNVLQEWVDIGMNFAGTGGWGWGWRRVCVSVQLSNTRSWVPFPPIPSIWKN